MSDIDACGHMQPATHFGPTLGEIIFSFAALVLLLQRNRMNQPQQRQMQPLRANNSPVCRRSSSMWHALYNISLYSSIYIWHHCLLTNEIAPIMCVCVAAAVFAKHWKQCILIASHLGDGENRHRCSNARWMSVCQVRCTMRNRLGGDRVAAPATAPPTTIAIPIAIL